MNKQEKNKPSVVVSGVVKSKKKEAKDQIELRSGEVQELMTRPASTILKSGITIILFFVVVLLTFSYFIVYPEQMTVKAKLFPALEVEYMNAPSDGHLLWLTDSMATNVKKGDTLAILIHNQADTMCLVCHVDGQAFKVDVLERNMDVRAGQHLFFISKANNDEQKHEVRGVIYLNSDSSSVLRFGQVVDINYKGISYPFVIKEFGSIANDKGKYPISISYVDSLKLFKNIEPEVCIAKIQTSNQTIFEKFFAKRLNVLDKYRIP